MSTPRTDTDEVSDGHGNILSSKQVIRTEPDPAPTVADLAAQLADVQAAVQTIAAAVNVPVTLPPVTTPPQLAAPAVAEPAAPAGP